MMKENICAAMNPKGILSADRDQLVITICMNDLVCISYNTSPVSLLYCVGTPFVLVTAVGSPSTAEQHCENETTYRCHLATCIHLV